jgi:hypothetical protein
MAPMPTSGSIFLTDNHFILWVKKEMISKTSVEKNILYQTRRDSLSTMSLPKTPVKPAKKTAA